MIKSHEPKVTCEFVRRQIEMKTVFVFLFTALVAAAHGLERYVYFFLYFSHCHLLNTVSEHLLNDKNVGGK